MTEKPQVKGPASYFPSIEAKYGQPIEHWLQLVAQRQGMKHMEIVNGLKTEHGPRARPCQWMSMPSWRMPVLLSVARWHPKFIAENP